MECKMRILERVMLFLYLRKIGPLDQNIIVGNLENGMKRQNIYMK